MANNSSDSGMIIAGALVLAVLLIPAGNCMWLRYDNGRLAKAIDETVRENRALGQSVHALNEQRAGMLVSIGGGISQLENRLERNKSLREESFQAERKLAAVKELIKEHRWLADELMTWKHLFPELFSGY